MAFSEVVFGLQKWTSMFEFWRVSKTGCQFFTCFWFPIPVLSSMFPVPLSSRQISPSRISQYHKYDQKYPCNSFKSLIQGTLRYLSYVQLLELSAFKLLLFDIFIYVILHRCLLLMLFHNMISDQIIK